MVGRAARDFRQFIEELDAEGDLVKVTTEVDPHLELAAIVRRVYETEDKAPLFEKLVGRRDDGLFKVLGAPMGASKIPQKRYLRIAKSLGLPSTSSGEDIIKALNHARRLDPIPPLECLTGPTKDRVLLGDDVDLEALPVPRFHEDDGGRYLQTFGMYVVQTPDGSWVNWCITRGMVGGKRTIVSPCMPTQDIAVIRKMWADLGKDMPFALCFGVPPAAIIVSGMPIPKGVNESVYIGSLIGEPLKVVKCETNDIRVPATAEIVLEGTASRTDMVDEGPFAEYHGHMVPGASKPAPVFHVEAMTFRKDPILPICVAGRATEENETVWALTISAEVLNLCQATGLPIEMAWSPFESHCCWYVLQVNWEKLQAMETNLKDLSMMVGHAVFGSKFGFFIPKIYLVGQDIDPTNLKDVLWAESTRCQPKINEFYFDQYRSIGLIPYVSHGISEGGKHVKVVRCCMFPMEFAPRGINWYSASFEGSYPKVIQSKVIERWEEYGF